MNVPGYVGLNVENPPKVMQLVKKYIPLHPICRGLGATYEDVRDIMEHISYNTLKHNMAYGLRHKGKLVSLTMVKIQRDTNTTWDDVAKYVEGNKKAELLIKT